MVNRRAFVTATALFPILSACGGGSNSADSVTPVIPNPGGASPAIPGDNIAHFTAGTNGDFALNGKPFLMAAGELHPGRIPYQYWDQRIKMVKSMGFNTVSIYDFWSMHETNYDPALGAQFDFSTAECNLPQFIDLCKQNNMWVFLRPGPFVDAFWDLGGIPAYLLQNDGVVLRTTNVKYMEGVARYAKALAPLILPRLCSNGGPIIMVQVENEYTTFCKDANYVKAVRDQWRLNGIGVKSNVLLSTNGSMVDGDAINAEIYGLVDQPIGGDPLHLGDKAKVYAKYKQPVFGAEMYSGWDTLSTSQGMYVEALDNAKNIAGIISGFLDEQTSFAMYVACGGTSFEYGAAGIYDDLDKFTFDANSTSYDYRAPINEQGSRALNMPDANGNLTISTYDAIKASFEYGLTVQGTAYSLKGPLDASATPVSTNVIPAAPAAYPMIALGAAAMPITSYASIWDNLPKPINSPAGPLACEQVGMYSGCGIVYQTTVPAVRGLRNITFERLADVATVFVDGQLAGIIDRRSKPGMAFGTTAIVDASSNASSVVTVDFGAATHDALLEVFVYTFGHTHKQFTTGKGANNFRKGIWGNVYMTEIPSSAPPFATLVNWNMYPLPMTSADMSALKPISTQNLNRAGKFFASTFNLDSVGDAYVDLSTWNLGTVWVNGHNLGRHSASVGPQTRWYCPGVWLNKGSNKLVIFDNYITDPNTVHVALLNTPSVY
jgi:beta-galactosidase